MKPWTLVVAVLLARPLTAQMHSHGGARHSTWS